MRIIVLKVCSVIFAFNTFSHAAGIQIGRTRVIYDANKKEVALSLTNTEKDYHGSFSHGLIPVMEKRAAPSL